VVTVSRGALVLLVLLALLVAGPGRAAAQTLSVTRAADSVKLRAPGWTFLTAEALTRLKEGRTVRVELAAVVLPAPGKSALTTVHRIFAVSYDIWEERFAVTIAPARTASVSHLTEAAAAAWCLEQVAVPVASLGGSVDRFWIRVECRILDGDDGSGTDDEGLTLQRLIDVLSRRRKAESTARPLEGGPFRLSR
jgi:hypothetical protein